MEDFFCATIGNYDGVHRGHQKVLEKVRLLAKDRGQKTMVVTFDKHPMEVICPERAPHPILSLDERVRKLKENKILDFLEYSNKVKELYSDIPVYVAMVFIYS